MVIYTPIPADFLLSDQDKNRKFTEIPFGEAIVVAEISGEGVCKVVRLISSDPEDYLNPQLQPGCEVVYKPVFRSHG